jgi:hypothetical protein
MPEKISAADHLAVLFSGLEPAAATLKRCATLTGWRLRVHSIHGNGKRQIVIHGALPTGPAKPALVLWMDRKKRWVLTGRGLFVLGAEDRDGVAW